MIDENAQLDSFGHARLSGIGEALAELIEKKTGFETRSVNLGHTSAAVYPRPMTGFWGSVTGCMQSTWSTRRSGAGLRCSRGWTLPTSRSKKRLPLTAVWISGSLM